MNLKVLARAVALLLVGSGNASAQTYSNSSPITINDNAPASPFGSPIVVPATSASVRSVRVSIFGFQHAFPADVQMVLVAPGGQTVELFGGCGGPDGIESEGLTFASDATETMGNGLILDGVYQPTRCADMGDLAAPAPSSPYGTWLGSLAGINPSGTWRLYVQDHYFEGSGSILGGWSLTLSTGFPSAVTYQGQLRSGGSPVSGPTTMRFGLWDDATSADPSHLVAPAQTRAGVVVDNGLFTTQIDMSQALQLRKPLWLEVAIDNGQGGFQVLSPRQPITQAPLSSVAQKSDSADAAEFARAAGIAGTAEFAQRAGSIPFSGVSGTPDRALFPPITSGVVNSYQAAVSVTTGTIPGLTASVQVVPGVALVNYSFTALSSAVNTAFNLDINFGGVNYARRKFWFNQANVHTTISGTALIPIPASLAGTQSVSILVSRYNGTGSMTLDTNDTGSLTVVILR